jgi:DNA-binding response OmpR family regulator
MVMPKVLVVADTEWVINDVMAALGLGDWEIETAADPKLVAASVSEIEPDAVIVDMQITQMGGMAVIRDIRAALEGRRKPRIVLLLDREADAFLAKRAGADAWLVKPFDAHDLRGALNALVG